MPTFEQHRKKGLCELVGFNLISCVWLGVFFGGGGGGGGGGHLPILYTFKHRFSEGRNEHC